MIGSLIKTINALPKLNLFFVSIWLIIFSIFVYPLVTKGVILGHDTHWHLLIAGENLYHFKNGDEWSLWLSRVNGGVWLF